MMKGSGGDMCDDHAAGVLSAAGRPGTSRREFLHGTAAAAAAAVLFRGMPRTPRRLPLRPSARPVAADGTSAYSMAMHIHSSFSEFYGSMDCHLAQATANAVDVCWWTDHDQRMTYLDYRNTVHFTGPGEKGAPGEGGPWKWQYKQSGPVASEASGFITNPCSPDDPVAGGALALAVTSSGTQAAKAGYYADCTAAGYNYRCNLNGQEISLDVLLEPGWTRGYLEVAIGTSYHPASAGRAAGLYGLSYRLVPATGKAQRKRSGLTAVVTIPVRPGVPGGWTTIQVNPAADLAAVFPDLDYRDFALYELTFNAASTGDAVSGYVDYLRFNRAISGEVCLQNQASMMQALAGKYPDVVQQQGLEISAQGLSHVNWFGGSPQVLSYGDMTAAEWAAYLAGTVIPQIQGNGGAASYNHPYGTVNETPGTPLPQPKQDALLLQAAAALLGGSGIPPVLGADLLEVGYYLRAGVDLAHHVALADILARNAVFTTWTGVSDDHDGTNWEGYINNWVTSAWAASAGQDDLLAALIAGQAYCGSLSAAGLGLNLTVNGTCPMGSVTVSSLPSRMLAVTATGVPAGGTLVALQGAVDYAGTSGLADNTQQIGSWSDTTLAALGGTATVPVDTTSDSFVCTRVLNASGTVVGLSNPAWLLQNPPPGGIPASRAA